MIVVRLSMLLKKEKYTHPKHLTIKWVCLFYRVSDSVGIMAPTTLYSIN